MCVMEFDGKRYAIDHGYDSRCFQLNSAAGLGNGGTTKNSA
jgi:hypothetical protein